MVTVLAGWCRLEVVGIVVVWRLNLLFFLVSFEPPGGSMTGEARDVAPADVAPYGVSVHILQDGMFLLLVSKRVCNGVCTCARLNKLKHD